jgi:hypothetical protein
VATQSVPEIIVDVVVATLVDSSQWTHDLEFESHFSVVLARAMELKKRHVRQSGLYTIDMPIRSAASLLLCADLYTDMNS